MKKLQELLEDIYEDIELLDNVETFSVFTWGEEW